MKRKDLLEIYGHLEGRLRDSVSGCITQRDILMDRISYEEGALVVSDSLN